MILVLLFLHILVSRVIRQPAQVSPGSPVDLTRLVSPSIILTFADPFQFAITQSWGWKSSSLDVGEAADDPTQQELSLRATVVIGLV